MFKVLMIVGHGQVPGIKKAMESLRLMDGANEQPMFSFVSGRAIGFPKGDLSHIRFVIILIV